MRVVKVVIPLLTVAVIIACCGCEWSSGGGAESWSDSYSWVNFSGTYRGIGGGALVTDYSSTATTPGSTNDTGRVAFGLTSSTKAAYTGAFGVNSIIPKSTLINFGSLSFADAAGDGNLTSALGGSGRIEYATGDWSVDLGGIVVEDGKEIIGSCSYAVAGTGSGSSSASSGVSGATIYSFVVWQTGGELQITDNNGKVYKGSMGTLSGTMTSGTNAAPVAGETVVAQFSASGVSAAGFNVTMAGNYQGVVEQGGAALGSRQMLGTWIEEGGKTGDIRGEAASVAITTTPTETTPTE